MGRGALCFQRTVDRLRHSYPSPGCAEGFLAKLKSTITSRYERKGKWRCLELSTPSNPSSLFVFISHRITWRNFPGATMEHHLQSCYRSGLLVGRCLGEHT